MAGYELANEQELAGRAATDAGAFSVLYDFYFPKIWSFIMRRVGHKETAEDLVSQIFLKVTEALPRRKNDAPFGAWVFRIATNHLVDHYRANGRRKTEAIDAAETIPSGGVGPDEYAEARAAFASIERVLEELPDRDRRVINMKFFAGLSNKEIAEVEKIKEGNAGVIICRALEKMRKESEFYGKPE